MKRLVIGLGLVLGGCDSGDEPAAPTKAAVPKAKAAAKGGDPKAPDPAASEGAKSALALPEGEPAKAVAIPIAYSPELPGASTAFVAMVSGSYVPKTVEVLPAEAGEGLLPASPTARAESEDGGTMAHPTQYGWSADGTSFAVCWNAKGTCRRCLFQAPSSKPEALDDVPSGEGEECRADATKVIDERLASGGFERGMPTWRYGTEVVLTWKNEGAAPPTLIVGARRRSKTEGPVLRTLKPADAKATRFFPELVILDPNGVTFALVTHSVGQPGADGFAIEFIGATRAAGRAFNNAGFKALEDQEWMEAVDNFEDVALIETAAFKGPFNIACAYAQAGNPLAEIALEEAIRRGGKTAIKQAKKDKDLAPVRSEKWFVELTSGTSLPKPPEPTAADRRAEGKTTFAVTGIKACDDYLAKYQRCMKQASIDDKAKEAALDSAAKASHNWRAGAENEALRASLEKGCTTSAEIADKAFADVGCL